MLIQWTPDTNATERGIDAVPEEDAVWLEWFSSQEEDVDKYRVFRSIQRDGTYSILTTVSVPDTSYLDITSQLYVRYYYFVTAVTDEDVTSIPSDTLDYKLVRKASALMPSGESAGLKPIFSWEDTNSPTQPSYMIRLVESATDSMIWFASIQSSYSGSREEVEFNSDGSAVVDSLSQGVYYQWRVDIIGSEERCGSESNWVTFRLQ